MDDMSISSGDNGLHGLLSGLDIDGMVKKAMLPQQKRYDQLKQQEDKADWTKDAYHDWYLKLTDYQQNTLYKYALTSSMEPKNAVSSDNSVVTATAGGAANCLSHQVTVNDMASNAFFQTVGKIKRPSGTDSKDNIKLSSLLGFSDVTLSSNTADTADGDYLTFKVGQSSTSGGKEIRIDGKEMDQVAVSFTIRDGTNVTDPDTGASHENYVKVSFTYRDLAQATLNDLANKINNGTNVVGQYDSVNDSFSLYNSKGGKNNILDLTVDNVAQDSYLQKLGLQDSNKNTRNLISALNFGRYDAAQNSLVGTDDKSIVTTSTVYNGNWFSNTPTNIGTTSWTDGATPTPSKDNAFISGTNGSVTIDGKTFTDITGNQLTVNGVTYTINSESPKDATGAVRSTMVSVSMDQDTIVKNVKQFVDDYNKLLSDLKSAVYTRPDSNFQPLTDEQKKAMTADQITKWTDKAKQGLLYNSTPLVNLIDRMRTAVNEPVGGVSGQYTSLSSIGISVSADWNKDKFGLLTVDESKLRKALASNTGIVYQLFNNPNDKAGEQNTYGIVKRLNHAMSDAIGTGSGSTATGIKGMAGVTGSGTISDQSYWGDKIENIQSQMKSLRTRMSQMQRKLFQQFDQMEVAMSKISSQYGFVNSYLGGGQ